MILLESDDLLNFKGDKIIVELLFILIIYVKSLNSPILCFV